LSGCSDAARTRRATGRPLRVVTISSPVSPTSVTSASRLAFTSVIEMVRAAREPPQNDHSKWSSNYRTLTVMTGELPGSIIHPRSRGTRTRKGTVSPLA